MLRTPEQREARQAWMRELQRTRPGEPGAVEPNIRPVIVTVDLDPDAVYDLQQAAKFLGCSPEKARRMFRNEPGVRRHFTPGGKRAMIRIPGHVIERVIRVSAVRGQPFPPPSSTLRTM